MSLGLNIHCVVLMYAHRYRNQNNDYKKVGYGRFKNNMRGNGRSAQKTRGASFPRKFGVTLKRKQPECLLYKPRWDLNSLKPFKKNFYIPHNSVSNRYAVILNIHDYNV